MCERASKNDNKSDDMENGYDAGDERLNKDGISNEVLRGCIQ